MTTRAEFEMLAAAHGIRVEVEMSLAGNPPHITLDAPEGKRFSGSQIHVDCACCAVRLNGTSIDWSTSTRALRDLIAQGFDDCDDAECEYCSPDGE